MAQIQLLKHHDIDRRQWDSCVAKAHNSLPYAYSWYLDAVAQNWDGIVYGNYNAVMPLVWLRKLGLRCIYQPYYCQQLGVFSITELDTEILTRILNTAGKYAPYIDSNLNAVHCVNALQFKLLSKKNLLLPLSKSYAELKKGYAENHRRNIAKAEKAGLIYSNITDADVFRQFYLSTIDRQREKFTAESEAIFNKLLTAVLSHNIATIHTAQLNNQVVAAVLLLQQGSRLISIINSSNSSGKTKGASHFLYNNIIQQYANSTHLLDFEGSSVATIARFYEGFGAAQETFYRWKTNIIAQASQRLS